MDIDRIVSAAIDEWESTHDSPAFFSPVATREDAHSTIVEICTPTVERWQGLGFSQLDIQTAIGQVVTQVISIQQFSNN